MLVLERKVAVRWPLVTGRGVVGVVTVADSGDLSPAVLGSVRAELATILLDLFTLFAALVSVGR